MSLPSSVRRVIVDRLRSTGVIQEILGFDGPVFSYPSSDILKADQPTWAQAKVVRYRGTDPAVEVSRYASLNENCYLLTGGEHHLDWVTVWDFSYGDTSSAYDQGMSKGPIRIGADTVVGFQALIMSGVTIGHGAVVAARAVVNRDVEPYAIVGGVPAKVIARRFDEPTRAALLRIAWWEWSEAKVKAHRDQLASPDVAGFVARHDGAQCPDCQGEAT